MKNIRLSMRYSAYIITFLFAASIIIVHAVKKPLATKVISDQLLSPKASKEIRALIFSYLASSPKATSCELLSHVQQSHPFITRITKRKKSNGLQTVSVSAEIPLATLNALHLITAQGNPVWSDYYRPTIHENLFNVRTSTPHFDEKSVQDICAFVTQLPGWVCEEYQCEWNDKTSIILRNKQDPRFIVKAYEKNVLSNETRSALQRLKNYYLAQETASKKRQNHNKWVIDIRFKNLMILSRQKGEQG